MTQPNWGRMTIMAAASVARRARTGPPFVVCTNVSTMRSEDEEKTEKITEEGKRVVRRPSASVRVRTDSGGRCHRLPPRSPRIFNRRLVRNGRVTRSLRYATRRRMTRKGRASERDGRKLFGSTFSDSHRRSRRRRRRRRRLRWSL